MDTVFYIDEPTIEELTAKEMFEKLNYSTEDRGDEIFIKLNDEHGIEYLIFDKEYKMVDTNMCEQLDADLLKAIYKQFKELGWL